MKKNRIRKLTEKESLLNGERETFRRLIEDVYPKGIVSIVSDTWDFWKVLTDILPSLKNKILAREGKVVIRPDSGDPELILCGNPNAPEGSPEQLGAIKLLDQTFGHTVTKKGFKTLNPKVGLIYGDSITRQRQRTILSRMKEMGYSSDCIVFGVGSFTYQYTTRDTHGFAMKATWGVSQSCGEIEIYKDPVTANGSKTSAKGLLSVVRNTEGNLQLLQSCTHEQEAQGELNVVFKDSVLCHDENLSNIRRLVQSQL